MNDTINERARQACMNSDTTMGLDCQSCANHKPCDFARALVAFATSEIAADRTVREAIDNAGRREAREASRALLKVLREVGGDL